MSIRRHGMSVTISACKPSPPASSRATLMGRLPSDVERVTTALGFTRLVCLIDEENVASIRVAGKMGMAFEKASRDEIGPFWLYTRHRPAMPEGDFDANTN